ncbi:MAG: PocR ligand-binding domain-containing protein [Deltaproteobacteria bacterium]|nr:PocR ligand-binding domain-containing protein [Deltaproteobacteria bacterium]MBW2069770.1 PocR ligand-binding domain-containing protein [Deltaproteobacteria bacterium]
MTYDIHLLDLVDRQKLDQILKGFTSVTGVASIIADPDGWPITKPHNFTVLCQKYCRSTREGRHKCYQSDRFGGAESWRLGKPPIYSCLNAGLLDCAAPVIVEGYHLATILCGQVLEERLDVDLAVARARSIGITDIEGYLQELERVPLMSRDRLFDIVNLMSVITQTVSELALGKYLLQKYSKRHLNRLINSVSDCIVSTDQDGIITMINESGANMFGAERAEMIGKSIAKLFCGTELGGIYQKEPAPRRQKKWRGETIAVKSDREAFPVQVSISAVTTEKGTGSDYVAVIRDISEEKKIDRMKEDLIGMVTHDMRNPVLSLQKALELLVEGNLGPMNESQQEIMRMALGTSHQLYGMANDLLDVYRSESGEFMLVKSPIDLNQIIYQSLKQLRFFAEDKKIAILFKPAAESIRFFGDQKRLIRVCVNLLDNAIKYSPEGREITVVSGLFSSGAAMRSPVNIPAEYERLMLPQQKYVFATVADQGLGIPQEFQQLVFDKFFKVKSRYQEGRKGVGLGLAFCKRVIEAHGGCIFMESPVSRDAAGKECGCRFSFVLPATTGRGDLSAIMKGR